MNMTTTAPVGEVSARVVWARPQEAPEEIARQVDLFMHGMRERTGISLWTLGTERAPWPKDQAVQAELVSQMKSTEGLARQGDWDGYAFWVRGFTSEAMAVAHVSAGQDHTGGRIPAQRADIEVTAVVGEHIPRAFTDAVVSSAVEGWDPLMVRLGTSEMQRLARRGNWKITPGYRLWPADAVGRIDHVADGVQAERVETGTLLTLPDDWSAQRVVDATQKTLELNGLDELPH